MQTKVLCLLVLVSILAIDAAKSPKGLILHVAINETDFLFPSIKEKHHALRSGEFIPKNCIPNGIAIYSKYYLKPFKIKFVIYNNLVCYRSQRSTNNFCSLS